jgi:hypothetical protein
MFTLETPELPAAADGFLAGVNVIDGAGHALFATTKYELPLDGQNRDVPLSAGAVAAPVLTKGATNATGGTFGAGTFYWKLTAVTGYGETAGSNEVSATLVATGSQVLSWAAVPGATLYRLYRGTAAGAENVLVTTVTAAVLTYTDTGSAGTAQTVPAASTAGPAPAADKVFEKITTNETVLFQSYRGLESPVLLSEDSASIVTAAYDRAESYGVGKKVQEKLLSPKAVDLTPVPGTPVTNPRFALGLLEQWARDNSTFAGTISGNALALVLVEDAIDGMKTILDTPAILASGYGTTGPGSRVAGPGQAWLYIHGRITVWRGPRVTDASAADPRTNRNYALAEGSYAASVDSFVAAVLVGTN